MTETFTGRTLKLIRERAVYNDDRRRELGLPPADSDIHQLLAEVERLRERVYGKALDPSLAEQRLARRGFE